MKRTEYITGKFTDYAGNQRNFVMAAVSLQGETDVYIEEGDEFFTNDIDNDQKILSIGVSVCRPNDEFDEKLGQQIAEGKAVKYRSHALYTTDAGLINGEMVKALLNQEANYFMSNPGRYLAGYDKDAAKWAKSERIESYINSLKGDAQITFKHLTSVSDKELARIVEALGYVCKG